MTEVVIRSGPGGPHLNRVVARLTDEEREALVAFAQSKGLSISRAVGRLVRDLLLDEAHNCG